MRWCTTSKAKTYSAPRDSVIVFGAAVRSPTAKATRFEAVHVYFGQYLTTGLPDLDGGLSSRALSAHRICIVSAETALKVLRR